MSDQGAPEIPQRQVDIRSSSGQRGEIRQSAFSLHEERVRLLRSGESPRSSERSRHGKVVTVARMLIRAPELIGTAMQSRSEITRMQQAVSRFQEQHGKLPEISDLPEVMQLRKGAKAGREAWNRVVDAAKSSAGTREGFTALSELTASGDTEAIRVDKQIRTEILKASQELAGITDREQRHQRALELQSDIAIRMVEMQTQFSPGGETQKLFAEYGIGARDLATGIIQSAELVVNDQNIQRRAQDYIDGQADTALESALQIQLGRVTSESDRQTRAQRINEFLLNRGILGRGLARGVDVITFLGRNAKTPVALASVAFGVAAAVGIGITASPLLATAAIAAGGLAIAYRIARSRAHVQQDVAVVTRDVGKARDQHQAQEPTTIFGKLIKRPAGALFRGTIGRAGREHQREILRRKAARSVITSSDLLGESQSGQEAGRKVGKSVEQDVITNESRKSISTLQEEISSGSYASSISRIAEIEVRQRLTIEDVSGRAFISGKMLPALEARHKMEAAIIDDMIQRDEGLRLRYEQATLPGQKQLIRSEVRKTLETQIDEAKKIWEEAIEQDASKDVTATRLHSLKRSVATGLVGLGAIGAGIGLARVALGTAFHLAETGNVAQSATDFSQGASSVIEQSTTIGKVVGYVGPPNGDLFGVTSPTSGGGSGHIGALIRFGDSSTLGQEGLGATPGPSFTIEGHTITGLDSNFHYDSNLHEIIQNDNGTVVATDLKIDPTNGALEYHVPGDPADAFREINPVPGSGNSETLGQWFENHNPLKAVFEGDTQHHDWQQLHSEAVQVKFPDGHTEWALKVTYDGQDTPPGVAHEVGIVDPNSPPGDPHIIELHNPDTTGMSIVEGNGSVGEQLPPANGVIILQSSQEAQILGLNQDNLAQFHEINTYAESHWSHSGTFHNAADHYQLIHDRSGQFPDAPKTDGNALLNAKMAGGWVDKNGVFHMGASNQTFNGVNMGAQIQTTQSSFNLDGVFHETASGANMGGGGEGLTEFGKAFNIDPSNIHLPDGYTVEQINGHWYLVDTTNGNSVVGEFVVGKDNSVILEQALKNNPLAGDTAHEITVGTEGANGSVSFPSDWQAELAKTAATQPVTPPGQGIHFDPSQWIPALKNVPVLNSLDIPITSDNLIRAGLISGGAGIPVGALHQVIIDKGKKLTGNKSTGGAVALTATGTGFMTGAVLPAVLAGPVGYVAGRLLVKGAEKLPGLTSSINIGSWKPSWPWKKPPPPGGGVIYVPKESENAMKEPLKVFKKARYKDDVLKAVQTQLGLTTADTDLTKLAKQYELSPDEAKNLAEDLAHVAEDNTFRSSNQRDQKVAEVLRERLAEARARMIVNQDSAKAFELLEILKPNVTPPKNKGKMTTTEQNEVERLLAEEFKHIEADPVAFKTAYESTAAPAEWKRNVMKLVGLHELGNTNLSTTPGEIVNTVAADIGVPGVAGGAINTDDENNLADYLLSRGITAEEARGVIDAAINKVTAKTATAPEAVREAGKEFKKQILGGTLTTSASPKQRTAISTWLSGKGISTSDDPKTLAATLSTSGFKPGELDTLLSDMAAAPNDVEVEKVLDDKLPALVVRGMLNEEFTAGVLTQGELNALFDKLAAGRGTANKSPEDVAKEIVKIGEVQDIRQAIDQAKAKTVAGAKTITGEAIFDNLETPKIRKAIEANLTDIEQKDLDALADGLGAASGSPQDLAIQFAKYKIPPTSIAGRFNQAKADATANHTEKGDELINQFGPEAIQSIVTDELGATPDVLKEVAQGFGVDVTTAGRGVADWAKDLGKNAILQGVHPDVFAVGIPEARKQASKRPGVTLTAQKVLDKIADSRREAIIETQINDKVAVEVARGLGFSVNDGDVASARTQIANALKKYDLQKLFEDLDARSDPDRDDAKKTKDILKPKYLEAELLSLPTGFHYDAFGTAIGSDKDNAEDLADWLNTRGITGRTLTEAINASASPPTHKTREDYLAEKLNAPAIADVLVEAKIPPAQMGLFASIYGKTFTGDYTEIAGVLDAYPHHYTFQEIYQIVVVDGKKTSAEIQTALQVLRP